MTICNGSDTGSWKDLYQYALFESDSNKLPKRIAEAETALGIRARELSHAAGDDIQEEESLDYAMRALYVLRSMLVLRSNARTARARTAA